MTPFRIGLAGSLLLHGGLVGVWWALADAPEGSTTARGRALPLTLAMFSETRPEPLLGDRPQEPREKKAVDPPPEAPTGKVREPVDRTPSEPLALAAAPDERAATPEEKPRPQRAPKTHAVPRATAPTPLAEAEQPRPAAKRAVEPRRAAKPSGGAAPKRVAVQASSTDSAKKLEEEYLDRLWRALERSKFYPRRARRRGVQGQVEVRFRVLRDGTFEALEVVGGSGNRLLDQAALQTVNKVSGEVPFPSEVSKPALVVSLPITYRWQ